MTPEKSGYSVTTQFQEVLLNCSEPHFPLNTSGYLYIMVYSGHPSMYTFHIFQITDGGLASGLPAAPSTGRWWWWWWWRSMAVCQCNTSRLQGPYTARPLRPSGFTSHGSVKYLWITWAFRPGFHHVRTTVLIEDYNLIRDPRWMHNVNSHKHSSHAHARTHAHTHTHLQWLIYLSLF